MLYKMAIKIMPESFFTRTLASHPYGKVIARILAAAVQSAEPGAAVSRFVERQGTSLIVDGQKYQLDQFRRILFIGIGKAAFAMTLPLVEMLADFSPHGLLIPKQGIFEPVCGMEVQPGGHPVPDENSLLAGKKVLNLVAGLTPDDLLICLISGGGSALMAAPYDEISLADLQDLTSRLLACGAPIEEINTLRRHLDRLKGGGLAKKAFPARVISLILSDVIHNPLEAIASGPTAPDPSTRSEALGILSKYSLVGNIPKSIISVLENAPETPKAGDALFEQVQNVIVGSNQLALEAALLQAKSEGLYARSLGDCWQGEARTIAAELCQVVKTTQEDRPFCLVAGGETTVTLHGRGRGGRNQELALAATQELAGIPDVMLISLATDGQDGPTDAAGAVVNGKTVQHGQALGLSPEPFLADNDSYTFFSALGELIRPGPSGTNVNDLTFLFGF